MKPLRSILVSTNFSDPCRAAFSHAARLSTWDATRLSVLHTVEVDDWEAVSLTTGLSPAELRQRTEQQVRDRFRELAAASSLPPTVQWFVRFGAPAEALESVLRQVAADLVIAAVDERSAAGTLAASAVRTAPAEVLVARAHAPEGFRRVLACVDFGPLSADVVARAVLVAQRERAELHVLHVLSSPWLRWDFGPVSQESERHAHERRVRAEEQLEDLLEPHLGALEGLRVHRTVAGGDNHSAAILDAARSIAADLVVLGSRGRRDLHDYLIGSTADRVLHLVHCSLWVVKPERVVLPTDVRE